MEGIQIYELKRMDLRGATVIDGFPSVGLVSSIVANYLINALNLVQIGIMDSVYFPTVALVRDGQPMNPVRIYAGPKVDDRDQIVVFISEFQPPPNLIKGIASAVLDWAQDARCNLLVCPEGLIVDAQDDDPFAFVDHEVDPVQHLAPSITGDKAFDLKHRGVKPQVPSAPGCRGTPRSPAGLEALWRVDRS